MGVGGGREAGSGSEAQLRLAGPLTHHAAVPRAQPFHPHPRRSAKEREYLKRVAELEAAARARETARKEFEDLRKQRLDTFMAGFR